jgi:hypothetical protein
LANSSSPFECFQLHYYQGQILTHLEIVKMNRLATIQSHDSIGSIPDGVAILNRESTLSLVGEGVNVQVNGDKQNNAYISADIIQAPQIPVQFNQSLNIVDYKKVGESNLIQLKVNGGSWRNASVILSNRSEGVVGEFPIQADGSLEIAIDEPGIYTASLSTNPSAKAKIVSTYEYQPEDPEL